jgi:hypothetical protein
MNADARYTLVEDGQAIKCHTCGLTSWHPEDVRHRFCGKCHVFHEDEAMFERLRAVTVTTRKPPAYNPRPMTAEPAGIEPPFTKTYLRRVRVEEDE